MTLLLRSLVAVVLGGFFLMGAARTAEAAGSTDSWITAKTKIALVTTSHVSANAVHVDTVDARVTLYGKVISELQKENAGSIAKSIDGVKSVRNLLQVVAESHEKAVDEADERIKERVQKALKEKLADDSITVKSVNKGAVLLSGDAKNLSDYLRAVESTSAVAGVHRVDSEVKSPNQTLDTETPPAADSAKTAARDTWITTATKLRLLADGNVPALDISVDTFRGNVTLFGIVPSAASRSAAVADTRKVDSVMGVNDELQIVPAAYKEWVVAKDDIIRRDIKTALKGRPDLKHVDVNVKNGTAHLTGTVTSDWQSLHAAMVARATKGVRSVDDDLRLEPAKGR